MVSNKLTTQKLKKQVRKNTIIILKSQKCTTSLIRGLKNKLKIINQSLILLKTVHIYTKTEKMIVNINLIFYHNLFFESLSVS